MAYENWEGSLHETYEEALLEAQDAQQALAAEGWKVSGVYVFEQVVDGEFAGYQGMFQFVEAGGELPGEASRWPTILLISSAFLGTAVGIAMAIMGSRTR